MAKRFKFRLETLLKIRRQREEQHQRIVADRLSQIQQVTQQMSALDRQIREETSALRTAQEPGIIDLQQTIRHRHWLGHLHKNALESQARLRFLEARLAQERNLLAEAVKQRRILEKLREHQQEKHTSGEERQTIKMFDEMANVRYIFNKRESALSN